MVLPVAAGAEEWEWEGPMFPGAEGGSYEELLDVLDQ